jgi:tetratricopeptide (TPR) repeat protein
MFLRKAGQQYLLLHNLRDGQGKQQQLRLDQFNSLVELRESLDSEAWRREFKARHPKLKLNWMQLAAKAANLEELQPKQPKPRGTSSLESQLRAKVELARSALPARRSKFTPGDPLADEYFDALEQLAEHLRRNGRLEQSAEIAREWARSSNGPEAHLAHGGALQLLGRGDEAREQYLKVKRSDHRRHYHLAALAWQQGQPAEALDHLLQAMVLCRAVARALTCIDQNQEGPYCGDYWEKYGDLWSPEARSFLLAVVRQGVVKYGVREALEEGTPLRELIPMRARARVLGRVLYRAGTFPPPGRVELTTT